MFDVWRKTLDIWRDIRITPNVLRHKSYVYKYVIGKAYIMRPEINFLTLQKRVGNVIYFDIFAPY